MRRVPLASIVWFVLSAAALWMALRAFQSMPAHIAQPAQLQMASPTPPAKPRASAIIQPPPKAPQRRHEAGVQLIKCVIHGQVTYTNDPQECPSAAEHHLTVYPTQGYLPARP